MVTLAAETRAVFWLILMYEAISLKKIFLPQAGVLAVLLCLAPLTVNAVNESFSEDFSSLDRIGEITANWSEADGTVSLIVGDRSLNDPTLPPWGVTSIGTAAGNSSAAVLADVNNDGELDLLVANVGQLNEVYLADGSGGFLTGLNIGSETDVSTSLALGDVDGDGDLDLFVGNSGLSESDDLSNKLYLNDGSGNFSLKGPATDSPSPDLEDTRALTLGDVDGDGDLDLVVANAGQSNKLYLNDGDANFAVVGVAIGHEIDTSTSLGLLDVDGDGDLDLIVGNTDEIAGAGKVNRLYTNDGKGGFLSSSQALGRDDLDATYGLAFGDVDNDGDVDLVAANKGQTNKLYINEGLGAFAAAGTDVGAETDASSSARLVDVDGDGDLDLVVGNENQTNKLYLNEGSGQFSSAGIALGAETDVSTAVCLGDVNGDGDMDLLVANNSQANKLYSNVSGGGFVALGADFGVEDGLVNSMAVADLNNDLYMDVVVGMYNQPNRIYLNDANGGFTTTDIPPGLDPTLFDADATYSVAIGDVDVANGNGPDIVVGNYGQPNKLYRNNGSGGFDLLGTDIDIDSDATYSIALVDVDGDGDLDLVSGNNSETNKYYKNDGAGNFDVGADIGADTDVTYGIALVDVVGVGGTAPDGKPDLITVNANQANKLYINNALGGFDATAVLIGNETDNSNSLVVDNVNGDAFLDIVVGNYGQTNKLYLNNGNGGFSADGIDVGSDTGKTRGLDLADVDGDLDLDLFVANEGQPNRLYLNGGAAGFIGGANGFSAPLTVGQEVGDSRFIKRVDLDKDGYSEVLVGNYGQTSKHYDNVVYRSHVGRVVSKQINPGGKVVRTAIVTANFISPNNSLNDVGSRNTGVDFYLSNNGGLKWHRVNYGEEFFFPVSGSDLRWKAELKSLSPVRTPVLKDVSVTRVNMAPEFTATPSIKGVFAADQKLEVINSAATDAEGDVVAVSYQWQSNNVDIPGATTSTYVLPAEKINEQVKVKVTAKDSEDGEVSVVTKPVSESSFDALGTGEDPDAATDDSTDASADEEVVSSVAKRSGGGGLSLLALLGLMLVSTQRRLLRSRLTRVVAPLF